ncbi:hypothetical protein D3C81_1526920 [compost metagenome]
MPWPDTPVSISKPDSRVKMPFRPPPRSSTPRRPQREPDRLPEFMRTAVWPLPPGTWLATSTPASTMPYRVTLDADWARAAPDVAQVAAAARANRAFFTVVSRFVKTLRCFPVPVAAGARRRLAAPDARAGLWGASGLLQPNMKRMCRRHYCNTPLPGDTHPGTTQNPGFPDP